jgi:hypothetical protein
MRFRPDLCGRLKRIQRKIMRVKRLAKQAAGSRQSDWPPTLRAEYEALCEQARTIQSWMIDREAA